jgi:hypothetical protein
MVAGDVREGPEQLRRRKAVHIQGAFELRKLLGHGTGNICTSHDGGRKIEIQETEGFMHGRAKRMQAVRAIY